MNRRAFLSLLGRGATLTAAGLLIPDPKRVYSFLSNNPLAESQVVQFKRFSPDQIQRVTANVEQWGAYIWQDRHGIWTEDYRGRRLISAAPPSPSA